MVSLLWWNGTPEKKLQVCQVSRSFRQTKKRILLAQIIKMKANSYQYILFDENLITCFISFLIESFQSNFI